ncbi:long-chain fatty acid--CoA ligase [Streptomyces sp. NPDC090499]|uniref:acyl-CoA synthetase n=1 Tax=Streptomyces sp. NPDC090499 TaxID=3365965 RepID=UPI0037F4EAF8
MYLTQSIHRAVQQGPDAPSTIFGDRVRTAAESADRISRLAGALKLLGVQTGDRVAMLALNSDRYHEYLLATWWAGAAVVPLNIRWAPTEILFSLHDSGAHMLLVDDAFAPVVPSLEEALDTVVYCGDGAVPEGMLGYEQLIAAAEPVEDVRAGGDTLAGIFYTGGTTGFPKGVMLSHSNLRVSATGGQAHAGLAVPDGRMLHAAPMFHLADLAVWTAQHLVGGSHVIIPAFEPIAVMKAIETHRVTSLLLVPVMIQMLVDHPDMAKHDLSSCHSVLYGASSIAEAVLKRAMNAFPNAGFVQAYGMTEVAPIATLLTAQDHAEGHLRSAGRAAAHSEIRIAAPDGTDAPVGTVGEVLVRGGHVMLGYWNNPADTSDALRGGWYHTGDGAYMDENGYLYIADRLKDMIVSGGENIYSAEVENAVAQHPAVATCAVIGVPDERFGERVHAVVVLRQGFAATAEEIRGHTKTLIAGYKAPRSVEFTDALPLSGAGKILKRELRKRYSRANGLIDD